MLGISQILRENHDMRWDMRYGIREATPKKAFKSNEMVRKPNITK